MEREAWLDWLKGMAICGVVMTHIAREDLPEILEKIAQFGANGVQLFFVISGCLLFKSYSNNKAGAKKWYIKRFLRLIPLYWMYLVVSLLLDGRGPRYWLGTRDEITFNNILSNFTFTNGFNPYYINSIGITWYIADLAIFILLIPILFKIIKNMSNAIVSLLLGILICPLIIRELEKITPIPDSYLWLDYLYLCILNQFPVLICGILSYFIIERILLNKMEVLCGGRKMLLCILLFCVVLLSRIMQDRVNVWGIPYIYWLAILFSVILCCGVGMEVKVLNISILRVLGKYSYGIYFSHYLLRNLVKYISLDSTVIEYCCRVLICLFGAFILSLVTTEFVEKPVIKLFSRMWNL